jgi:hypothetical protein
VTFIQPPALELLPHPFFIVTEGMSDARLVDNLLQSKNITNCSVGCPSTTSSKGTGKDAYPNYLAVIQIARGRAKSARLSGLLVIADADADANATFHTVTSALESATFPSPAQPFSIEGDPFRVAVYLLPGQGKTGTLDHLLLEAALTKASNLAKCLDDFSACTGALRSAKPNQLAKMRMSALAAAFCEDNPWCSANTMLCDSNSPVPISSSCFDHLSGFLAKFSS